MRLWSLMEQGEVKRSGRGQPKCARGASAPTRATPRGWCFEAIGHKDHDSQKEQRASWRAV